MATKVISDMGQLAPNIFLKTPWRSELLSTLPLQDTPYLAVAGAVAVGGGPTAGVFHRCPPAWSPRPRTAATSHTPPCTAATGVVTGAEAGAVMSAATGAGAGAEAGAAAVLLLGILAAGFLDVKSDDQNIITQEGYRIIPIRSTCPNRCTGVLLSDKYMLHESF